MLTTSFHVLVNMADFGDDLEIERDVLAAKRSHEDDDTFGGESDGTSGTSASTESDVVTEKRGTPRRLPQTKTTEKGKSTCVHSLESSVAVRVEEAATGGNSWIWCLKS